MWRATPTTRTQFHAHNASTAPPAPAPEPSAPTHRPPGRARRGPAPAKRPRGGAGSSLRSATGVVGTGVRGEACLRADGLGQSGGGRALGKLCRLSLCVQAATYYETPQDRTPGHCVTLTHTVRTCEFSVSPARPAIKLHNDRSRGFREWHEHQLT